MALEKAATTREVADDSVEARLLPNALEVLRRRYLRRGSDGKPVETVEQMFRRVVRHVALVEEEWDGDVGLVEAQFYELITELRFLPNSPTFTGAGTPLGQLAACFVLPISDDMGRKGDGIFQTLRDMALIQQTGGGTGFSFSKLRPRGSLVRSSGGQATGPVGFMRVYDTACKIVSQGGARRGANMAVLRVDHPDIQEFIECKMSEDAINNFNISVGATDLFMQAVKQDGKINLLNPHDGAPGGNVRARELFDQVVAGAHRNGEPGLIFLDTANRDNPCPHLGEYEATNPCAEQFLLPYENCCLGSVNLARHLLVGGNGRPAVDWKELERTVALAVRFLDDVVEANAYVPAVPQLKEAAHRTRRIGLGIMGLGDLMYYMGIRYGGEEAQEFAAQIMEFIRYHAVKMSVQLARERSPFPAISGSVYDPKHLTWTPPQPVTPFTRLEKWGRPELNWSKLVKEIRRHGIRNAAQTTVAPTGTIATVAGCEAYGCEPTFGLAYVRHVNDNGHDLELTYTSPLFLEALERAGLDQTARDDVIQQVMLTGSCQDVEEIPPAIRHTFVVAGDISAEEHVRMQAALQAFVDASISKTINFPATATTDDVARAFQLAWELGCKGLTVYVAGSREKAVLETGQTRRGKTEEVSFATTVRPRPHVNEGQTYRMGTPLGTAYITVNRNGDGEPFEVFLNVGKAGSDTAAVAEAIGRLISLALRIPSPISATRRMQQVILQLKGIGGGRPLGFGRDRVRSLPDGVAQALAEHLGMLEPADEDDQPEQLPLFAAGDLCPECGHAALVSEEGCRHCFLCGYSEC
jgi:ribonucleoside-diphosphate reductase alpha chain